MSDPHLDEQDPLWKILGDSQSQTASPRFIDNVVRASRQSASASLWERLGVRFCQRVAAGVGLAAVAFATLFALHPTDIKPVAMTSTVPAVEVFAEDLGTELLVVAVESPHLFSDEEILALLF